MAEKKIALITGANKGIGKEIARQLGALGMTVLIGARDAGRGEEAATELKANGADAHTVRLDVTDAAGIEATVHQIESEYGKLDVLVNNAGIALDGVPGGVDVDTLRRTYETNVLRRLRRDQGLPPPAQEVPGGPHRQPVQRAGIAHSEQRPQLGVRGR